MNPETQAKVDALLAWIADNAVKGGDFVKEQAPDVARQIVAWGIVEYTIYLASWTAILVLALCWARFAVNKSKASECDDAEWAVAGLVPLAVVFIAWTVAVGYNGVHIAKPLFAPKVYLLEQLKVLK